MLALFDIKTDEELEFRPKLITCKAYQERNGTVHIMLPGINIPDDWEEIELPPY